MVTVILMSYKRKPNMPAIVQSYRDQTVETEIWMINNDGLEDFGADRLIAIPWNAGEMARYLFTRRARTEYVCFQDDDVLIGYKRFLEDAISIHQKKCPDGAVGTAGRTIQSVPPHYRFETPPDSYTNFLKGHFQLFSHDILSRVHLPFHPFYSDIQFGLDMSRGLLLHWVSRTLRENLIHLDTHGVGLEFRPTHWSEREELCAHYIKEYGFA